MNTQKSSSNSAKMVIWHQRSPVIYRYLEKEYVDEFFNEGKLRLSSFLEFKAHTDEQRKDKNEGKTTSVIPGSDFTVYANTESGRNALIMSASQIYEAELLNDFNVDSCFSINNPPQFGLAICRQIPEIVAGVEGPCIYLDMRAIKTNPGNLSRKDFNIPDNPTPVTEPTILDQEKAKQYEMHFRKLLGDEPMFIKEKTFEHQKEYRLIWFLDYDAVAPETLDIICPEAVQFCSRII